MDSQPAETLTVQELQQLGDEDTGRRERAQWVLNSPDPPGLLHDLIGSVKEVVLPHGHTTARQTASGRAMSFLQGLFPIFSWGKGYRVSKFKNDLMAGLTLASLSIPQVLKYIYLVAAQ